MNRGKGPDPNVIAALGEARRHIREVRISLGLAQEQLLKAHSMILKQAKGSEHDNARRMLKAAEQATLVAHTVTSPALDLIGLTEAWL